MLPRALVIGLFVLIAGCAPAPQPSGPVPIVVVKPTEAAPFDRTFAWRAVDGATTYEVVVFNDTGKRSFEVRDLRGTSVAVSPSVALAPGRYSWQVRAFKNGQPLSESAVTPFELR